jgi:hypothetical protein
LSSIALSRNAASYCSRPRLRSQPPRSIIAPELPAGAHDHLGETACLGVKSTNQIKASISRLL